MRNYFYNFVLASLALLAAGCAHVRPTAEAGCTLTAIPLTVNDDFDLLARTPGSTTQSPFRDELKRVLDRRLVLGHEQQMLVLSGGSQKGAFGAGFLAGLSPIPTYQVVTGVSTGALQSTLAFLANDHKPMNRSYPHDVGFHPDLFPPGIDSLKDLALSESITSERSLLKPGSFGLVGAVTSGSAASLQPLADRIYGMLSETTLLEIAAQPDDRALYVGVTDVDSGRGYAIDLTELARRTKDPQWRSRMEKLRHCYVDALIASSAVPLAAYPVSLEIHDTAANVTRTALFVDGGARFGLLLRQVLEASSSANEPVDVDVIVNGNLSAGDWRDSSGQLPQKWSAVSLAQRSADILINQVYLFSADDVKRFATMHGSYRLAYISNNNLQNTPAAQPPGNYKWDNKTCQAWSDEEDKSVLEFHPHYMDCLLHYGQFRAGGGYWNFTTKMP